jgi:hypothetical protein
MVEGWKLRSGLFLYVESFLGVTNDPKLPSIHVYKYKYSHAIMMKRSNKVYAGVSLSSCSSHLVRSLSHMNICPLRFLDTSGLESALASGPFVTERILQAVPHSCMEMDGEPRGSQGG